MLGGGERDSGPKVPTSSPPHTSAGSSSLPLCPPGISLALKLPVCPSPPACPIRTSGQTTERHRRNDHTPHSPISTRSLLESHPPTRNPEATNLFSVSRISSQECYINVIARGTLEDRRFSCSVILCRFAPAAGTPSVHPSYG